MNAPLLWIGLPLLLAVLLALLNRRFPAVWVFGVAAVVTLGWMAWQLPIGEPIDLRLWAGLPALRINPSLSLLGSRFVLDNSSRPYLAVVYLSSGLWFAGGFSARAGRLFMSLGLSLLALLTAAIAIEPRMYAPLILLLAVFSYLPLFSLPGKSVEKGALRTVTFQSLGFLLIFLGGLAPRAEALLVGLPAMSTPALFFSAIGIALVLGIFPFHSWIPMLAGQTNPYPLAFFLYVSATTLSFWLLGALQIYGPPASMPLVFQILLYAGLMMALTGGLWALFERHAGRILGFAVINQVGAMLLALSMYGMSAAVANGSSLGLFMIQLVPQALGLVLLAQSLAQLYAGSTDLSFMTLQGKASEQPVAAFGLAIGLFSLAGLPLLASYPTNLALWTAISQVSIPATLLALAGSALLMFAGVRLLAVLLTPGSQAAPAQPARRGFQNTIIILCAALILVAAMFPQLYAPLLNTLAGLFTQGG
jgi:NADH-quinone oxidoreductase subunit N